MPSASVSLYIYGEALDTDRMVNKFRFNFDLSRRKGEKRELSDGRVVTQKIGVLRRYTEPESTSIAPAVSGLVDEFGESYRLDTLDGVDEVILDIFYAASSADFRKEDFSFVLTREVLERISALGASLSVTVGVVSDTRVSKERN